MDLNIQNRVALVTASSRGLGKAVALELSREGARVALMARSEERVKQAKDDISSVTGNPVRAYVGDVTSKETINTIVDRIIKEWGTIDILVCNAGGPPAGMVDDLKPEDYRKAADLNLHSTIDLCYAVLPYMKAQGWGRIINITSVSAKQPIDALILSNTVRAGVLGFSKSLSNQVAASGITVNSVCPGYTRTERVEELAKAFVESGKGTAEDFYHGIERAIPAGRLGQPGELAKAVTFLASDGAAYISGIALQVDGGFIKSIF